MMYSLQLGQFLPWLFPAKLASDKRVILRSTSYKVPLETEKLSALCNTLRSSSESCSQAKRATIGSCIDSTSNPLFRQPSSGAPLIPHHWASCPSCSSVYSPSACRNVFITMHFFRAILAVAPTIPVDIVQ